MLSKMYLQIGAYVVRLSVKTAQPAVVSSLCKQQKTTFPCLLSLSLKPFLRL